MHQRLFWLGIAIYVLSFFLPSVNPYSLGPFPGWACAWVAFFTLGERSAESLAFFGALINPIAIAYVVLHIRNRAPRVRVGLALAILLFIPLTWVSLVVMRFPVEIGHVAWIVGLLLMMPWADFRRLAIRPTQVVP
jgi:hypothetical protein